MILLLLKSLRRTLGEHEAGRNLRRHVAWLLVLSVLFVICFKLCEQSSWNEAVWQAWQTNTTVGYGNAPAETLGGRVAVAVFGTLGIALVGVCISGAFDLKQAFRDMRRFGMQPNPFTDGYVIFNFPGLTNFRTLVAEIRTIEPDVGVCVVDGRLEELPPALVAELPNLHFVRGDALSRTTYERAAVRENKVLLVFPMDPSTPDSDSGTMTLVNILARYVDDKTRIIATLVNPDNESLLMSMLPNPDDTPVSPVWQNMDILAVVQECQDEHSAELVAQLLANTRGANPCTLKPTSSVGMTWADFTSAAMACCRRSGVRVNPFGLIHRDGTIESCPSWDTVILATDKISLIAFPGFSWERFEADLTAET